MLRTNCLDPRELGVVRLASPCNVKWSSMRGNDTVRHCAQCRLNVFNFEKLTSFEVRDLVLKTEGRICGRFFRRSDGTMLTRDCPRGWAHLRHLWREEHRKRKAAPGLTEYVLIVSLIAISAIGIITFFGDNIRRLFGTSTGALGGEDPSADARKRAECDSRMAVIRAFDGECRALAQKDAGRERLRALGVEVR
jgi:Flp pilus assembly pilin Flp